MIKIETHCHTIGTSKCADCENQTMIKAYKDAGYGGIVVTNHMHPFFFEGYPGGNKKEKLDYYFGVFDQFKKECEEYGLKAFLGMEVLATCIEGHAEYILYGFDRKTIYESELLFKYTQEELFRFAEKHNIFMYKAHPFRTKEYIANPKFLHGAESFNGHYHHKNNNDQALEYCEKNNLIGLSGTDFHHPGQVITAGIYIPEDIENEFELTNYIRKNQFKIVKEEELYKTTFEKYIQGKII